MSLMFQFLILVYVSLQMNSGYSQNVCPPRTQITRLKNILFCGYDKTVRPTVSESDKLDVSVLLRINFIDFDEASHILKLYTWTVVRWNDSSLHWDPQQHDGIEEIILQSDVIWAPDLSLLSLEGDDPGLPSASCWLSNAGAVACVASMVHAARCSPDLARWPLDEQRCTAEVGSWAHPSNRLNFVFGGKGIEKSNFLKNKAWELVESESERKVQPAESNDTFVTLSFALRLRRHSGAHLATVVLPAFILSVMTLLTLFLEAGCPERITLGCMNALAHCLYLQYLGLKLPPNGDRVPAIVVFFRDSMFMVGASLVLAVLVRGVGRVRAQPPQWLSSLIRAILNTRPGQLILLSQLSPTSGGDNGALADGEGGSVGPSTCAPSPHETWQHAACALDRVCLVVFAVAFFALLVGYVP